MFGYVYVGVCLGMSTSERLHAMAQPGGEGFTWYIFAPDGQLLKTKIGSWTTPSKDLWPGNRPEYQYRQEWAIDALWGAANGPVGSYQGSEDGGFPLPPDFWGTGACAHAGEQSCIASSLCIIRMMMMMMMMM